MSLSSCVTSFILVILCGNPVLKGAFVTLLNSLLLTIDQEITILTAQLGRLNVINRLLNFEIQTVQSVINKVTSDLNLILGPFQQYANCPDISRLQELIQQNAVNKNFVGLQNKLYELNRATNLANVIDAVIKQKQKHRTDIQDFIDRIADLCP
jgi:hypothetical protein